MTIKKTPRHRFWKCSKRAFAAFTYYRNVTNRLEWYITNQLYKSVSGLRKFLDANHPMAIPLNVIKQRNEFINEVRDLLIDTITICIYHYFTPMSVAKRTLFFSLKFVILVSFSVQMVIDIQ